MINLNQFGAVIFDMDGVLTDSEPLWKIAMEECFQEINCPLTKKDFQKTVGLRLDEVIEYWYAHIGWENASPKEVENRIVEKMVVLLKERATPLPGIVETLRYLKEKTRLKIGLATSSYRVLIDAVLQTLQLEDAFDFTHSAEDEAFGKPHPAVYLTAAKKLAVAPKNCLVVEDSLTGVISGKAARMTVICIPEKSHLKQPKLILADYQFETMAEMLDHFSC